MIFAFQFSALDQAAGALAQHSIPNYNIFVLATISFMNSCSEIHNEKLVKNSFKKYTAILSRLSSLRTSANISNKHCAVFPGRMIFLEWFLTRLRVQTR